MQNAQLVPGERRLEQAVDGGHFFCFFSRRVLSLSVAVWALLDNRETGRDALDDLQKPLCLENTHTLFIYTRPAQVWSRR